MLSARRVEDWATLSHLLDEALELPPDERAAWVGRLPPAYASVQPRLAQLLSSVDSAGTSTFLRTIPKIDAADQDTDSRSSDTESTPGTIGPYRVVRRLARGGMGTVWLAYRTDVMVNRPVALKLPNGTWPLATLAARLDAEREILATLSHPNIAQLYDAGVTPCGRPYLALEYVEGRPLDEYVSARLLSIQARLRLFVTVVRAVAHAHARLIVHQDLKPSNILVTDQGEVKLLDFGIAELLKGTHCAVRTAAMPVRPHTPAYASPEQIAGASLSVATDVYSSGVILYELLTGQRPSSRGNPCPTNTPPAPSSCVNDPRLRRRIRGDLDAIVQKALQHDQAERYSTMESFADDVERHLLHAPVAARADGYLYRASTFVRRRAGAVTAAAVILTAIVSGSGLAIWQRQVALTQRAAAVEVRDFLATLFRDASPYSPGGPTLSAVDWLKDATARIDHRLRDRPALRVELLTIVGSSLLTLQDTAAADAVISEAVREGAARLGEHATETLRARVLMTAVRRFRGQTTEMRAELTRLLPELRTRHQVLAEDLVVALKNQTHLEIDEGHYAAAAAAAEEGATVARRALGDSHPETVAAILMRAYARQFSQPPDVAVRDAEEALRLAQAVYGDVSRHPRAIEGRFVYGRALSQAGEWARSAEQLGQAVSDATEVFGPSSRMVGTYSVALSESQLEIGRVAEALRSGQTAVAILEQHVQPESFRYAKAVHGRGVALLAARRAADAVSDLARASEVVKRVLPQGHQIRRQFETDLALALAHAGDPVQARMLLERQQVWPDLLDAPETEELDDPSVRRARYAMGVAKRLAGDASGALPLLEQVLHATPPDHREDRQRMLVLIEIGLSQLELARPSVAKVSLERALGLARETLTQSTPDVVDIMRGLGLADLALGRSADGYRRLRDAKRESTRLDVGTGIDTPPSSTRGRRTAVVAPRNRHEEQPSL